MLHADLTLKIQTTAGPGGTTETIEYYKGNLMRRDFGAGYQVVDFSTGRSFSFDPEKKEYYRFNGAKRKMKQVTDRSHKILINVTCAATGEQHQWFGYSASRYLTTKKSHEEINGQPSGHRETHLDAWVLDMPVPPHVVGIASPNANAVLGLGHSDGVGGGVMTVPDLKVTHSGPLPHGLVVRLKTEQYESEVVALSLAPLDESLFEVPNNFRAVTSFELNPPLPSWSDQLALEWMRFRIWLDSLMRS